MYLIPRLEKNNYLSGDIKCFESVIVNSRIHDLYYYVCEINGLDDVFSDYRYPVNTKTFVNIVSTVEFSDLRILLNESNSLEEKYFSLYDIKSFIGHDINYKLGREYYVKTIDKYVLDGKILTMCDKIYP